MRKKKIQRQPVDNRDAMFTLVMVKQARALFEKSVYGEMTSAGAYTKLVALAREKGLSILDRKLTDKECEQISVNAMRFILPKN